jgi:hypothetical protein
MPQTKKKPTAETPPQQPQEPQQPQQEPQEPQETPQEPQETPQEPQETPQQPEEPQETPQQPEEPQRESQTVGSAVIVPHPTTVRGPIEETHNKTRDDREQQYVTDRSRRITTQIWPTSPRPRAQLWLPPV